MKLFPIGTVVAATNFGTIDSINYKIFEPNNGCRSFKVHTTLTTLFQSQVRLTRKKAAPYLTLTYMYDNIFDREFKQIEHFVDDVDDALTAFHIIDLSRGQSPSYIASSAGTWTIGLDNTRFYSATANFKSNKGIIWDGHGNWKIGDVSAIKLNASVNFDISTNNYGALTDTNASIEGLLYPLYEVYLNAGAMSDFKSTNYVESKLNTSKDGGLLRSGTITFLSKYKVGK